MPALGVLYLVAVVWAIMESATRWMTLLLIVVSWLTTASILLLMSFVWPHGSAIFGHVAAVLSFVISGFVGITHMRAHRRVAAEHKP
jgi:hypothetical protein